MRRLRKARGLSQEELARRVGVSKTQVYLVESGQTKQPQGAILRRYARALGITVEYLKDGIEPNPAPRGEMPPLEVYLRHTSTLSEEEIAQVVRIIHALEAEQQRELALRERESQADGGESVTP